MTEQLDRIEHMLRALCAHLGVRDVAAAGNGAGVAETAAGNGGGPRHAGVVSRFEHGWGFIECEAMNRNFFVHYSDIEGTGLRSLEAGEAVSFEVAPGKDGRPKAVRVKRQPASRPGSRVSRIPAIPRPQASQNGGQPFDLEEEAAVEGAPRTEPPARLAPD